jgi:hypothetical protein
MKIFGLKPFDYVILLFALAAIFLALGLLYGGAGGQNTVKLKGESGAWVFPLDAEETVEVPGPLGITVVEVRGGRARVLSSPCQNQTCIAAGAIHSHGQWVACLPNLVLLSVEGRGGDSGGADVDAAAW